MFPCYVRKHVYRILGQVIEKNGPFNDFFTERVFETVITYKLREIFRILALERPSKTVETFISILGTNNEINRIHGYHRVLIREIRNF